MGCGTIGGDLGSIQYLWRKFRGMGGLLRLHRCDHRRDYCRNAHDDHDAGHVVGKHVQRHLRRPFFSVRILKCVAPIQDLMVPWGCSTVMLRTANWIFVQAFLHAIEDVLILPSIAGNRWLQR
jgi:hypothetical protein